jgi:hypothetical protein
MHGTWSVNDQSQRFCRGTLLRVVELSERRRGETLRILYSFISRTDCSATA